MKKEGKRKRAIRIAAIAAAFIILVATMLIFFGGSRNNVSGNAVFDGLGNIPVVTIVIIAIIWIIIIAAVAIVIIRVKKKSKKEAKIEEDLKGYKKATEYRKSRSETDLDILYHILQEKKMLRLTTIPKIFDITEDLALSWCKVLEEGNLASIKYPTFGSPTISLYDPEEEMKKTKNKEKKKEAVKAVIKQPMHRTLPQRVKNPMLIKIIAVLNFIAALSLLLFAALFFIGTGFIAAIVAQLPLVGSFGAAAFIVMGLVAVLVALVVVLVGIGLLKRRNWARITEIVLLLVGTVLALLSLIQGNFASIGTIIIYLLIGGYLIASKKVRAAFAHKKTSQKIVPQKVSPNKKTTKPLPVKKMTVRQMAKAKKAPQRKTKKTQKRVTKRRKR